MKNVFSCLFAFFLGLTSQAVLSQGAPSGADDENPVLISNNVTEIRLNEFLADLTRLPKENRGAVANRRDLIDKQLTNLLEIKTMAVFAEQDGLDKIPENQAILALARQSQMAVFTKNKVYEEAEKEFEEFREKYEMRANERYQIEKNEKHTTPPRVLASHILIEVNNDRGDDEAKARAEQVRKKILSGEDFNKVAADFSDDITVKRNHGRLGWVSQRALEPPFAKAAFALEKDGDISELVRTIYGWHIIKREGYKDAELIPFDSVKATIMEGLKRSAMSERINDLSAKIRTDSDLTIHEDAISRHVHIPPPKIDAPTIRDREKK
jgi:peptidyl-prolyl cis-trans isomerase C